MSDASQPYSTSATALLARHNKEKDKEEEKEKEKEKEKKISNPEEPFNRIFLKETNLALRPLHEAATGPLDGHGWEKLEEVMNDIHYDQFRIADAPHTCATCAIRMTEDLLAGPCGPIQSPVFGNSCVCCVLNNRENECCTIPAFFGDNFEAAIALCDVVQASMNHKRSPYMPAEYYGVLDKALSNRYDRQREIFREIFRGIKKSSQTKPRAVKNENGPSTSNKRKRGHNDVGR